jgi:hypothetical protein
MLLNPDLDKNVRIRNIHYVAWSKFKILPIAKFPKRWRNLYMFCTVRSLTSSAVQDIFLMCCICFTRFWVVWASRPGTKMVLHYSPAQWMFQEYSGGNFAKFILRVGRRTTGNFRNRKYSPSPSLLSWYNVAVFSNLHTLPAIASYRWLSDDFYRNFELPYMLLYNWLQ